MSAPLGQATVLPSRKNRWKYFTSFSGSNTGLLSQGRKFTVVVVLLQTPLRDHRPIVRTRIG
jgi:hypothetical protein